MINFSCLNNFGYLDSIRRDIFPGLNFQNDYYRDAFLQFLILSDFCLHYNCKKVLEIGSGISTIALASAVAKIHGTIHSIDYSFDRFHSSWSTDKIQELKKYIVFHEGFTIGPSQLEHFYENNLEKLFGFDLPVILNQANSLTLRNCPEQRWHNIIDDLERNHWNPENIFMKEGKLYFPEKFLNKYTETKSYQELKINITKTRNNILHDVFPLEDWDLIFFDSGEVSTMPEWEITRDQINAGTLVAFHDIYFPKSMKSFLPCASLILDPRWEVLYVDNSTIQGLLVARKVK